MCRLFKLGLLVLTSTALGVAAGCYATPPAGHANQQHSSTFEAKPVSQQLIIKFRPGTISCDQSGIASISKSLGVELIFIRPMSGAACVVTHKASNAKNLMGEREKLVRHEAVEWAEPDAVMKTQ